MKTATLQKKNGMNSILKYMHLIPVILFILAGCNTTNNNDPEIFRGDFVVVTSFVTNAVATEGSSFLQTADLNKPIDNSNAYEVTLSAHAHVYEDVILVTENYSGDILTRYTIGNDGLLIREDQLTLPAGSLGSNVLWERSDKAFVTLSNLGKIWIINPQTMEQTGEIDLTELDIARNSSNPEDRNPEPTVMIMRDGKLYVALHQVSANFLSEDGVDIAVFDAETGQFEKVISDSRSATPGRYGFNSTMFFDEQGDLYILNYASFGFLEHQHPGFLRIPAGSDEFDPDYFLDLTEMNPDVPGNRIDILTGMIYAGEGIVYAVAQVPELQSSPANYATDRFVQPVRIDLYNETLEVLPLPTGTGASTGIALWEGHVLFGINAATGSGIYSYNPATGEGSESPVTPVSGSVWVFLPLSD